MHKICNDPARSGQDPSSVFDNLKWRRRGTDRRSARLDAPPGAGDHVEKRCVGDRRRSLMDVISKIIFPRLNDEL
ncbi:hypothetical protein JCM14469_00780 [Desulfatiferula olefinivorans]